MTTDANDQPDNATSTALTLTPASGSPDTDNAVTVSDKRVRGRPFAPGNRANPLGRPRKGQSLPELLKREYEKQKKQLVQAAVKRALREDQVGNRAFDSGLDRAYGKVADEMHLSVDESPLMAFLMRRQDRVVDGEYDIT